MDEEDPHESDWIHGGSADRRNRLGTARRAGEQGFNRFDLQRHDLPGREMIQVRVALDTGVASPRHSHPGEEIIYVLEGSLGYEVEGQPTVTLKPGDVLFIPAGTIHAATAAGAARA